MGFLSESDSSRKVTLKSVLAVAVLGPDGYQECVGIWHLAGSEMPTSDRRKLPVQECICIWLLAGSEMPMSDRRNLPVRRPHFPHYLRGTFANSISRREEEEEEASTMTVLTVRRFNFFTGSMLKRANRDGMRGRERDFTSLFGISANVCSVVWNLCDFPLAQSQSISSGLFFF